MEHHHLDNCFVDRLREPVRLLDRAPDGDVRARDLFTPQDVNDHLHAYGDDYSSRFVSVCQRNSWQPLQATQSMLAAVVAAHGLGSAFWDVVSCFYVRSLDLEQAFCVPFARFASGPWIDVSYTVRYPELREADGEWAMRQSGVYHRFNTDTRQSVFVLFSPRPESRAHGLVEDCVRAGHADDGPLALHDVFFAAYLPAWRRYMAAYECQFVPMANTTFATFIEQQLRVNYDHLSAMASLENRFQAMTASLEASQQVLAEAAALVRDGPRIADALDNHGRQCLAFARAAEALRQRARTTAQLLATTLSLRDQLIAKEQNTNMLQLNKSAVFITTLTLVYAPASFASSFFGMNFFAMDQPNGRIVATSMIWIYLVSTACLTAATVAFYYWLVQHDGLLVWSLTRPVTKPEHAIELRSLSV